MNQDLLTVQTDRPVSAGGRRGVVLACVCLLAWVQLALAAPLPPRDGRDSVSDWRGAIIAPDTDADVARAQAVFETLLRAWDGTRVAPALYVVDSAAGPWAASLADGNILLSRAAIDACSRYGAGRADHLLAFVLAHELAHQQANDLWHQRFFRRADRQAGAHRSRLLDGMDLRTDSVDGLPAREARADHAGLLIMASVGFDPYQVVSPRDFFTDWVENLWRAPCAEAGPDRAAACRAAATRALRTRAQLETLAGQASLYELGVQAFVGNDFERARRLFSAFGREHPGRLAFSALGLVDLSEARRIQTALAPAAGPGFEYPLLLARRPAESNQVLAAGNRRGLSLRPSAAARDRLLRSAADHFEKAIRLAPEHPHAYLMLGVAYLMADNRPMTRGVLQGRYQPRFGPGPLLDLLLAMALAGEDPAAAEAAFDRLLARAEANRLRWAGDVPDELLSQVLFHNAAVLAGRRHGPEAATAVWRRLAGIARGAGSASLFRLAVARLGSDPDASYTHPARFPEQRLARPGDRLDGTVRASAEASMLWLDGDRFELLRYADGRRLLLDREHRVRHAWQSGGDAELLPGLGVGDSAERPFKVLGAPDRQVFLQSGEYLCYDRLGLAVHLVGQRVAGWMLLDEPD